MRRHALWHTRPPTPAPVTPATDQLPPTPPVLSAGAPGATTIPLSWSGATDNVGVTGYRIYADGTTLMAAPAASPYTLAGLTPSTTYSLTVRAVDAAGNQSASSNTVNVRTIGVVDTTPPTAPTLSAGTPGSTSIPLSWSGATDNVGVTSYDVYRAGVLVTNVTASPYTDTGLTPSTAYSYTVRARDAAGNQSVASNTVSATTAAAAGGAIIPVGVGTNNATSNDTTTSLPVSKPSGSPNGPVVSGDVLYTGITTSSDRVPTTLSGWTLEASAVNGTTPGTGVRLSVYRKVAGGAEPASYTWAFPSGPTSISCMAFRNEDQTSPTHLTATAIVGAATSATPGALSPDGTDMVLVIAGVRPDVAGAPALSMPSTNGWTVATGAAANGV